MDRNFIRKILFESEVLEEKIQTSNATPEDIAVLKQYLKQRYGNRYGNMITRYEYELKDKESNYYDIVYTWKMSLKGGDLKTLPRYDDEMMAEMRAAGVSEKRLYKQEKFYRTPRTAISSVPSDPNFAYRGMSLEEWVEAKKRGYFQSTGEYNLGDIQAGLTFFGDTFETAKHYTANFSPIQYTATRNKPGVVIAVPKNKLLSPEDMPGSIPSTELAFKGKLPISEVYAAWMVVPSSSRSGDFQIRLDNYTKQLKSGSSSGTTTFYTIVPIDLSTIK